MQSIALEIGTHACVVLDALRKYQIPIRGHGDCRRGISLPKIHRDRISQALKGRPREWSRGENNPNWQGGRTKAVQMERSTIRYKEWKNKVFERDKVCIKCGSSENRVAHHVKFYQEYPELRFDLSNGIVLCRSCHSKYHLSLRNKTRLTRRTSHVDNSELAGAIAQGAPGMCDGQA